jgi:protocatechuate 3,4-dioxygenase, beta subunit
MKNLLTVILIIVANALFFAQSKLVGGGCEGCELYTEGMPKTLSWKTEMVQGEKGEKLQISGIIFQKDGKTPAKNVILYIYHTDNDGLYKASPTQKHAKRHGRLRGWMITDSLGRYQFTTIKPATYPNTKFLAHIHPTIKEPDKNEYYIDDFVFADDPNMNDKVKKNMQNRGGNGVVTLSKNTEGVWIGKKEYCFGVEYSKL